MEAIVPFHAPEEHRFRSIRHPFHSSPSDGNNGLFTIPLDSKTLFANCIVSDGMGWEHVSVSLSRIIKGKQLVSVRRCPTWEEMCALKGTFWDVTDAVVQYHPTKDDYVNCHPFTLHLWRPTEVELPLPLPIMVGPQEA